MIHCQTNKLFQIKSPIQCIVPICEELNYETSQVKCPHRQHDAKKEQRLKCLS